MGGRNDKALLQFDWFNVTYRSVYGLLLLVGLVGGAYFGARYYINVYAPRSGAQSAITEAEQRYRSAAGLQDRPELQGTLAQAASTLEEAQSSFADRMFEDARFAALRSAEYSQQALSRAEGEASKAKDVRFYRIEGDVRVKKAGKFSWESAHPKMTLGTGDQVKTSSGASAQLIYFDGTLTTVEPGSLIEIRDLYEDPVTKVRRVREKLSWGEVTASTSSNNVRGSYHEVSTDKASARAEDASEFTMSFDREKQTTTVDAFSGKIEVAAGGKKESLEEGERIRARADGKLTAKQVLPGVPRPITPADQRVFIFENPESESISLSWEPVAGAEQYRLVIADGALFANPAYDATRAGTSAVLEGVPTGNYYWKVAAIGDAEQRGRFCEPRGFRVSSHKIKDRDDTVPPDLQITEFVTVGMMVIVNGQSEPGATLWVDNEKVEVYDDGRFYAVVRLRKEGWNELLFRAQDTAGNESKVTKKAYVEFY